MTPRQHNIKKANEHKQFKNTPQQQVNNKTTNNERETRQSITTTKQ